MLLHPGSHNHPLTAPTVSPEMKYLWKNGYTQAIGITTSTAIAMRIDSVGIEFLYCCSESPAVGLLAMYWIFWIILFSNACNDVSFFSLIYKED